MSRPFCQSSRVTIATSGTSSRCGRPARACSARLLAGAAVERVGVEVGGQVPVGRRVPDVVIEAVEDAVDVEVAVAQQAVEAAAALAAS